MMEIAVGAHTDAGDVKKINQDSILYKTAMVRKRSAGLFVVADGCGGLCFGDEISKLAVTHFERLWSTDVMALLEPDTAADTAIMAFLEQAVHDLNSSALDFGKQTGKPVGTTLSLLLTVGKKYYIKNIGDSRIYLIRGKNMLRLTEDQSLLADMLRNGELLPDEAKNFKKKNVLTMCVGMFEHIKTYTASGYIKNRDVFLLCCDGLYNYISDGDFTADSVRGHKGGLDAAARSLREKIPRGNAADNVSVILAGFRKKWSI
jgi:protein phosphatase